MMIKDKKTNSVIVSELKVAKTFSERLFGLMFKKEIKNSDSLLFYNCRAIHTHFMCCEMDALFLNKKNEVIAIIRKMKPWRFSKIYFKADKVIELSGGALPLSTQVGDELEIVDV